MATENKPLAEKKCRDCAECVLTGWWDCSKICKVSGFPVDQDSAACISFNDRETECDPMKL